MGSVQSVARDFYVRIVVRISVGNLILGGTRVKTEKAAAGTAFHPLKRAHHGLFGTNAIDKLRPPVV